MSVPHDLHAPVDMHNPEQPGICDRCGAKWPLRALNFQFDIRGNSLQNLRIRVCPPCYDAPAEILRPIIIRGPEGVGLPDPRPYHYQQQNAAPSGPQLPFAPGNPMLPVTVPEKPQKPSGEWDIQGLAEQVYFYGYPGA